MIDRMIQLVEAYKRSYELERARADRLVDDAMLGRYLRPLFTQEGDTWTINTALIGPSLDDAIWNPDAYDQLNSLAAEMEYRHEGDDSVETS
jgi:hypothetical protein